MPRLILDRYLAYDDLRGCDLATGEEVRLDSLPRTVQSSGAGESGRLASGDAFAPLLEVLNDARDGEPRWIVLGARNGAQASALAARMASAALARGFIPMLAPLYLRWRHAVAADLDERTLFLIGGFHKSLDGCRAALIQAASCSARPHVLLTFRNTVTNGASFAREARAAFSVTPINRMKAAPLAADVLRLVEKATHAESFQRSGRHAAAERLLRDVAGGLLRRRALVPAASTLIDLGRMVMERGRSAAAEKAFDEAAQHAQAGHDELAMLEARVWQAVARTDAARLSDAESLCRAVLLTRALTPDRHAWASAALARVLLWQGRCQEAASCISPRAEEVEIDPVRDASVEATAIRVLLATGDSFHAGLRARALLTRTAAQTDALPRLMALAAHLRVLAEAGDLTLAHQCLQTLTGLARHARMPLRAVRARLIWLDVLHRSGRSREAGREREHLARLSRATPLLLRRAIEGRLTPDRRESRSSIVHPSPAGVESCAATLLRLIHDDDNDRRALERIATRLAQDLHTTRIDLVSSDAGPVSTLMTTGTGLATHLGTRTLEAGFTIQDEAGGGREIGMPIRMGTRLVAAFVCRWPLDRQPPPHAVKLLELAAAVAAPRADALLASLREAARASTSVPELIGDSAAIQEVRKAIERAAKAPFAVLIEGESGVGKELVARAVHQLSARRERRFCDVNCAALPDDLLESELFGHMRGAFTGAVADKPGLFEEADGGTLFLDEVPDLSPRGQAKLLRVLQQQEVRRVGETVSRKVDVRLITAANRDMRVETDHQRFRPDLLYRIDVIRIRIPPLRERPEDVALLASHFWRLSAARVECGATLSHGLLCELARYHWPGNVRELQNVMAALAVAAPARGRVRPSMLPGAIIGSSGSTPRRLADARSQFERRCVEVALARTGGNRTQAARELGLSRQGLLKTMARLGLEQ